MNSAAAHAIGSAVELRLGKTRRRFAQNLIRAFEFEVLALQLLQLLAFVRRQAWTLAAIAFRLADPPPA